MVILVDSFDRTSGLLLPVYCPADWIDFKEFFVDQAPNPRQRAKLFSALQVWTESVQVILPISEIWVNGGFVTYKPQIPEDIDVVAFSAVENFTKEVNIKLKPLTTDISGIKMKPIAYGGKIDSFVVPHTMDQKLHWMHWWSSVKHPVSKLILPGIEKGYVTVTI